MVRRLCIFVLLLPAAVVGVAQVARAASSNSCDNPADSALNQYCETIPSTGGGQHPGAGTRALGATLPPAIVHEIVAPTGRGHARSHRHRRLLTLPAPARIVNAPLRPTEASTAGFSTWVIVILVLMALALAGGAYAERRRRRSA